MSKENIHRAMGSLAYAVALADGEVQPEEIQIIRKLAFAEFSLSDSDNDWIQAMFAELQSKNIQLEEAYQYALDVLEYNRHDYDFDEGMKTRCRSFLKKIADAFGEISWQEQGLMERFESDLSHF
jgi:uncharacterized tellurite resistance protein B-like protein